MVPSLGQWGRKSAEALFCALNFIVFLFLDAVECVLCPVYRFLDSFFEGEASPCYCATQGGESSRGVNGEEGEEEGELSESLYRRENIFREMWFLAFGRKRASFGQEKRLVNGNGGSKGTPVRWSDCGCETCVSWMSNTEQKLHVVVKEPSGAVSGQGKAPENVIFLHGFLASSSLWTESVFPHLSESGAASYRLFAVDLLGFGKSPKPRDCSYTLKDHLNMIEKSVICPFQLDSFHIVAHSMGCVVAVALASKYETSVKSVTLTAPPYFPSSKRDSSLTVLRRLAEKRLWPPLLFGSSVMSWYEHLGRCICFIVCRNHRTWERILKFITRRSDVHFTVIDLTRHTHHSAWHTMHNVICGGTKLMDGYLETLRRSGAKISIIHGDRDQVVPLECSLSIKARLPDAEINIIRNANHNTVIFGRERDFTRFLGCTWESSSSVRTS
ncbi:probable lysophospholipase BODYGUARD 4 isoform X2 [Punica granatum]|uniref:Probable lysophospholipase BODYGUARD 4 isoform X2 n=1 Tax=Punica granatum TaxID=22663 RepID=A0A6P8DB09_PUNGR|nr:probable lysophospholipase BODYGUARD 4 isoform X2 [Punica granatum]